MLKIITEGEVLVFAIIIIIVTRKRIPIRRSKQNNGKTVASDKMKGKDANKRNDDNKDNVNKTGGGKKEPRKTKKMIHYTTFFLVSVNCSIEFNSCN